MLDHNMISYKKKINIKMAHSNNNLKHSLINYLPQKIKNKDSFFKKMIWSMTLNKDKKPFA